MITPIPELVHGDCGKPGKLPCATCAPLMREWARQESLAVRAEKRQERENERQLALASRQLAPTYSQPRRYTVKRQDNQLASVIILVTLAALFVYGFIIAPTVGRELADAALKAIHTLFVTLANITGKN